MTIDFIWYAATIKNGAGNLMTKPDKLPHQLH